MGMEIERKFLVANDAWRAQVTERTLLRQGYLSSEPSRVVRVRIAGEQAFLTIKGLTSGISRAEWEYPIPMLDAQAMLAICERPLIEKYRSLIRADGLS